MFQLFLEKFCFMIVVICKVSSVVNNYCNKLKVQSIEMQNFVQLLLIITPPSPIFTPLSVQTTSVCENYLR